MKNNIIIAGVPRAGKSTVSHMLFEKYGYQQPSISHSKYYQFMNVVRERKVDFGYIHGVNIEKNIRSIYRGF